MRLLVTDAAAQPPRQATAWLIMTLGRQPNHNYCKMNLKDFKGNVYLFSIMLDLFTILIPFLAWWVAQLLISGHQFTVVTNEADFALAALILSVLATARGFRLVQAIKDERKRKSYATWFLLTLAVVLVTAFLYIVALVAANDSNRQANDVRFLYYCISFFVSLGLYLINGLTSEYYEKKTEPNK